MTKLGASKVSLASFSAPALWKRSGRYKGNNAELFQVKDRKGAEFLLSPTHEEEITTLVESAVSSYKQLPLLLYQISRKYRDEPRPRQGLLRTREFLMKDLYTFDATSQEAMETYARARNAYKAFFDELRIPYFVADADPGSIGGSLSHEYHVPTPSGEDTIISCASCSFTANEELARSRAAVKNNERSTADLAPHQSWFGISKDKCQLVEAILPRYPGSGEHQSPQRREAQINQHLIKTLYPDLDLGIQRAFATFVDYWKGHRPSGESRDTKRPPMPRLTRIYDYRISQSIIDHQTLGNSHSPLAQQLLEIVGSRTSIDASSLDLARIQDGDECPECGNHSLKLQQAVELGHTFYLGDRYSKPMNATFTTSPAHQVDDRSNDAQENQDYPARVKQGQAYFQMGCHGIGVSRIIAAVADSLADTQGLLWPSVMAPFEAAILATEEHKTAAEEVWDILTRQEPGSDPVDAVLDDRDKSLGWKLKDADLIGFPVVIVLGSTFSKRRVCEVSVRRWGSRQKVAMRNLRVCVASIMTQI
ncbi:MAG: hypothetical protein Q9201_004422 [Fulgogasparrea decipioides]